MYIKKYKDKTLIQNQQPKIGNVNTNNNNRTLLVGPSFSGKTYPILKILSRKPDRDIYIINKSPPEKYSNSKLKNKEKGEEKKLLNEHESAITVFDDFLNSSNNKFIDQVLIRGRHNNLNFWHLSQTYIHLPKRTKQNNSNKLILFKQTIKDIE